MPLHNTVTYHAFLINKSNVLRKKLELVSTTLEEAREEFLQLPIGEEFKDNSKLWAYISPYKPIAGAKAKPYWSEVHIPERKIGKIKLEEKDKNFSKQYFNRESRFKELADSDSKIEYISETKRVNK